MPTESVVPFRQFVLKVHSRCDLACDHCYVYAHADQSWRVRPKVITAETVLLAAGRIAEHARRHQLDGVRVVLHGGEPLLAGPGVLTATVRALRTAIEPECPLDLRIHTNGVRINEEFLELFLTERVLVGVSVDGDRAANDLHRRYADGRSSYDEVLRGISLLRTARYREIYAGLLCTVDVRTDPVAVYRALAALEPPAIDFLLPHATWEDPPPGGISSSGSAPYASWLAAAYDAWADGGRQVSVRMFDSIIATTYGGVSRTEALGLATSDIVVIETDGSIEQADSLKVAFDGAPATGLHIATHRLDDAAAHPGIKARQRGLAGLSEHCRRCPVATNCGGGLYAHRYRADTGFDNPSVYCADLKQTVIHIQSRLRAARPAQEQRAAHMLSPDQFDGLAAGYGDAEATAQLTLAQRSIQRTLLRLLRERADPDPTGAFDQGWELASRVERADATALDEVLAHPYVRTWAWDCLHPPSAGERVRAGPARSATAASLIGAQPPGTSHLAGIAASAAIRARLPSEIDVPVTNGFVCLPTLGRLHVGPERSVTVAITSDRNGFEVRAAKRSWSVQVAAPDSGRDAGADWEPVRELNGGTLTVRLEDIDPYRDCYGWAVEPRLSARQAASWQDAFAAAWSSIQRDYPGFLPGLAGGLTLITPLVKDVPGRELSAAARQAFGAVGVALPADSGMLTLLLLHEFQHVKLGALLDLFELTDPTDRREYPVPWREDSRPVEAVLQGAYAHLAVTEFWRVRRHLVTGPAALTAAETFARWRVLTAETAQILAASGALTPLGERFVVGMRGTVDGWLSEPVPLSASIGARRWVAERRSARDRRPRG